MKDAGGKLMATMQGLGGAIMGDEVVTGAMASFAFESFEIASLPQPDPRRRLPAATPKPGW